MISFLCSCDYSCTWTMFQSIFGSLLTGSVGRIATSCIGLCGPYPTPKDSVTVLRSHGPPPAHKLRTTPRASHRVLRLHGPIVDTHVVDQAGEEGFGGHVFAAAYVQAPVARDQ